eukprot:TRINITY_DN5540_c0_g1_i14.p1 TRINITY_DN5540_c0_g1~~TRINITY_DN5540_c0_g1_i14.p1  ORF type:complete len:304 (-),score=49.76 TRINITY_DN5540_c0_g1_i14:111-1022(-)
MEHKTHNELMDMIGGYEPTSGFEFARYRGDFLTGFGMLLNQALIQYAIQFLHKKGYTAVQTPSLVKESIMKKLLPLVEFEESLYKIHGNANDEPLSLVSTSAHPLCAFNMGCTLVDSDLPMKYASATTCFRKKSRQGDAGHVFGIHRQSERIELFVFSNPDQSWDTHEEIIRVSEEFYESLNLPYRVVNVVSGELEPEVAKKYSLECWFPTEGSYEELSSCSHCTDYQARRMDVRFGHTKTPDCGTRFVHTLNSVLCALERTLSCILENYQCEGGILVPTRLKPYLRFAFQRDGDDVIPFVCQ